MPLWAAGLGVVVSVGVIAASFVVAGLVLIQNQLVRAQIEAAAEIDFDLLADELPPAAYSDPGFLEFLKSPLE